MLTSRVTAKGWLISHPHRRAPVVTTMRPHRPHLEEWEPGVGQPDPSRQLTAVGAEAIKGRSTRRCAARRAMGRHLATGQAGVNSLPPLWQVSGSATSCQCGYRMAANPASVRIPPPCSRNDATRLIWPAATPLQSAGNRDARVPYSDT